MLNKILIILLLAMPISAYTKEETLSELIDATYNFHPHELSKEESKAKSKILDEFWNKALANKDEYLPELRRELNSTNHNPFFYFNAGLLLLNATDLDSDRELFLSNITKSNLADVDNTFYLRLIFDLGKKGFDTSDAALHLLPYPDFKAFIPEHYLSLGIGWSLNILLIPQKEDLFLHKIIDKIQSNKTDPQNIHLIYALWYADSPEALTLLQEISKDSSYPEKVHTTAKELIEVDSRILLDLDESTTEKMYKSLGISSELTYQQLKEFRQTNFRSISDESLGRYRKINSLMKRKRIATGK